MCSDQDDAELAAVGCFVSPPETWPEKSQGQESVPTQATST